MSVAFKGIGAKGSGSSSVLVPYPTGLAAGDIALVGGALWLSSGTFAAPPAGWTARATLQGGTGSSADNHTTRVGSWTKELAGTESGNVDFGGGGSSRICVMAVYEHVGDPWEIAHTTGTDDTHGADRSVTASSSIALAPGDVVVCVVAVDTDVALTITAPAITAPGITFGATTRRTSGTGSTGGEDGNIEIFDATVTAGTATATPSLAFTTVTNQCGPVGFVRLRSTLLPPGVPTSVTGTPADTTAELSWAAPATGGPVDHYEARIDGGTPVSPATSPHEFTGLTAGTGYDLEVRAVGPGGSSAWVLVHVETLAPTEPGYYRVQLAVGPYSWDISTRDDPEYGPRLPISWGWAIPDTVEFFPSQADQTTCNLRLYVAEASDIVDIIKGSTVSIAMYVDADPDAPPWQTFDGIVTQLDGEAVNGGGFLATVYATDDTARLAELVVGYTADWPQESISDRVERICDEAGVTYDTGVLGTGLEGILGARAKSPIDALSALRAALKDAADEDSSTLPGTDYYGRHVITYDPSTTTMTLQVIHRRVPGEWQDPPEPVQIELDGCLVDALGSWSKLPGPDGRTWAIVDTTVFGTPAGPPITRSTSLVDTTPTNPSAVTRDNLGESLVPSGSTQLTGWYARQLRYQAHAQELGDPDPCGPYLGLDAPGLASWAPLTVVIPVTVVDVLPKYDLQGVGYIAGTLTGARVTIPPGGRYYVDLRLRPELLPGMELPA